jgi:hypothetical protein
LKKEVSDKPEKAKKVVSAPTKIKKTVEKKDVEDEDDEGFTQVAKGGKKVHFTAENLYKHLAEIIEARGKKVF